MLVTTITSHWQTLHYLHDKGELHINAFDTDRPLYFNNKQFWPILKRHRQFLIENNIPYKCMQRDIAID